MIGVEKLKKVGDVVKVHFLCGYEEGVDRCAVGEYSKRLFSSLRRADISITYGSVKNRSAIEWFRYLRSFDKNVVVHMQYPMEGWGNSVLPGLASLLYRVAGGVKNSKFVVTLHEWQRMHPLRKFSIVPLVMFASDLIFVSRQEMDAYERSFLRKIFRFQRAHLIPIGVNVGRAIASDEEVVAKRNELMCHLKSDAVLLGFFGFIYDAKQPYKMLDVARIILDRGRDVRLVIMGSFPDGHDAKRRQFEKKINALGLAGNVVLKGYIEDEKELLISLKSMDCVLQLYDDGLSARRSSFWFAVEAGVNLVTTTPHHKDEFRALNSYDPFCDGKVLLVGANEDAATICDRMDGVISEWRCPESRVCAPSWEEIAEASVRVYEM